MAEVIEIHRVTGWYGKCSKWDSFSAKYYWTIFGGEKGTDRETVAIRPLRYLRCCCLDRGVLHSGTRAQNTCKPKAFRDGSHRNEFKEQKEFREGSLDDVKK